MPLDVYFPQVTVVTEEGDDATFPKAGDIVQVHYTGTLADGTKFDSSLDRGNPIEFQAGLGQVIEGWDEAILKMSLGQKATLTIPPELGYARSLCAPLCAEHAW